MGKIHVNVTIFLGVEDTLGLGILVTIYYVSIYLFVCISLVERV